MDITAATVATSFDDFIEQIKALGMDATDRFPQPRKIKMLYRRENTPFSAVSFADAYGLIQAAAIHGLAVDLKLAPTLWCEDQLVTQPRPVVTIKIEEALLAPTKMAREAAMEAIPSGQASADAIDTVLSGQHSVLMSIDKKWCVEKSFFKSVIGESAVARVIAEVGRCLPTEPVPKTISETIDGLERLGNTKLLQFVGLGLQGAFRSALDFVQCIKSSQIPKFGGDGRESLLTKIRHGRLRSVGHTRPSRRTCRRRRNACWQSGD